jgi:hypothetical protein
VHQRHARCTLQFGNALADGALGQPKPDGGGRIAAGGIDDDQRIQVMPQPFDKFGIQDGASLFN